MKCEYLQHLKTGKRMRGAFKMQGCQRLLAIDFKVSLTEWAEQG
jgi:hypothetical protein